MRRRVGIRSEVMEATLAESGGGCKLGDGAVCAWFEKRVGDGEAGLRLANLDGQIKLRKYGQKIGRSTIGVSELPRDWNEFMVFSTVRSPGVVPGWADDPSEASALFGRSGLWVRSIYPDDPEVAESHHRRYREQPTEVR